MRQGSSEVITSSVAGRGRSRLARPRAGGWRVAVAGGRVSMSSPRAVVRAVCGGVCWGVTENPDKTPEHERRM
jgi:hypothetical protein